MWDWDTWEIILADLNVNGEMRKVAMNLSRNGFLYVLDRTNGQLLSAQPFEKVNWADRIDMKTGRPVESEVSKKLRAGETVELLPSIRGAKNWPHAAFNPNTGLLYGNPNDGYATYRFTQYQPYKAGARYQSVENISSPVTGETLAGHMEAIGP